MVKYILDNDSLATEFEKRSAISREALKTFATSKTIPEIIDLLTKVISGNGTLQLEGGFAPFVYLFAVGCMFVADVLRTQTPYEALTNAGSALVSVARDTPSYASAYASSAITAYGMAEPNTYVYGDTPYLSQTLMSVGSSVVDYVTYRQAAALASANIKKVAVFITAPTSNGTLMTLNGNVTNALETAWKSSSPEGKQALIKAFYQAGLLVQRGVQLPPVQQYTPEGVALPALELGSAQLALGSVQLALPGPGSDLGPPRSGQVENRAYIPTFPEFFEFLNGANIDDSNDPATRFMYALLPIVTTDANGSSILYRELNATHVEPVITDSSWNPRWMTGVAIIAGAAGIQSIFSVNSIYSYLFARTGIYYAATYAYVGDMLVTYQYGDVRDRPAGWYSGANQSHVLEDARIQLIPKVFRDEVIWKTAAGAGTPDWPWRSYKEVVAPGKWLDDLDALVQWNPLRMLNIFSAGTNAEYAVTTGFTTDQRACYYDYAARQWKFQNHVDVDVALVPELLLLEARWKLQQGAGAAWRRGTYQKPRVTPEYTQWVQQLNTEYKAVPALQNIEVPWRRLLNVPAIRMPQLNIRALWGNAFPGVPLQRLQFPLSDYFPPPIQDEDLNPSIGTQTRARGELDDLQARGARFKEQQLQALVFTKLEAIETTNLLIQEKIAAVRARLNR